MATTTSSAVAAATGACAVPDRRGSRSGATSAARAPATATPPSSAASVSGRPGPSAASSPSTNPMPVVLVSSHPATAAPLPATPARYSHRPGRANTSAPQPTWNTASSAKASAACPCSPCTPTALAWITPAPIDAIAASAGPVRAAPVSVVVIGTSSAISPC